MSDSYQAIYDATRSKIQGGSSYDAIYTAAREAFDCSYVFPIIQQEFCIAAGEMARPSAVYKPKLYPDGNTWCALYGENLQEGCAGFGKTPNEAMQDFDQNWGTQTLGAKQ